LGVEGSLRDPGRFGGAATPLTANEFPMNTPEQQDLDNQRVEVQRLSKQVPDGKAEESGDDWS
jgi:hypothetical protein